MFFFVSTPLNGAIHKGGDDGIDPSFDNLDTQVFEGQGLHVYLQFLGMKLCFVICLSSTKKKV